MDSSNGDRAVTTTSTDRHRHLHSFARIASPGLEALGFGAVRVPTSLPFMPIRLPDDLWYTEHTQNRDLHVKMTDDSVSLRMHIDTFHGDRPLNEAAFDLVRDAVESELILGLPRNADLEWRAARGGDNQVLEMTGPGGVDLAEPAADAAWIVQAASALLTALRRHPVDDLRAKARSSFRGYPSN